jgi:DNA-binding beta-propeller fold protein YncE
MKDQVSVVEGGNPRVQVFSPEGKPLLCFGKLGERPGEFKEPTGIALDEEGQIFVVEGGNHRIQKFDPAGKFLQQWGTWGYPEGLLSTPGGLAYARGRLYVADTGNHRIQVFDRSGTYLWQWGAASPVLHGGHGRLHFPGAIGVTPTGARAVVCEPLEHRCQVFSLGNARSAALVNDLPWWESLHARFHAAMFPVLPANSAREIGRWGRSPPVLAAMPEQESHYILFFDISLRPCYLVTRMGGVGRRLGEFRWPSGLTVDGRTGRFFICDRGNRRVEILELPRDLKSSTGFARTVRVISAFAPDQMVPKTLEGYHFECATLDGVALDPEGNVLVADATNGVVLMFDPEGRFIRAIRDASPPDGLLERPVGVAVSPDGKTVYTVDQYGFRIVARSSEGAYRFSWGRRGAQGETSFLLPTAIAVDGDGFVYVADAGQQVVKKFDSQGKFVLQWGGYGAADGQFSSPTGIVFIRPNRIVVEDFGNHRGQVFTPQGEFLAFFYKGGKSSPFPVR